MISGDDQEGDAYTKRRPEERSNCQDRYGLLPVDRYNHRACAMCYSFLFKNLKDLVVPRQNQEYLISKNVSHPVSSEPLAPDITNSTLSNLICSTLEPAECVKWRSCCNSALDCCVRQRKQPLRPEGESYCKRTWDGYSCWDDTSAGVAATVSCPSYVSQLITDSEYDIHIGRIFSLFQGP